MWRHFGEPTENNLENGHCCFYTEAKIQTVSSGPPYRCLKRWSSMSAGTEPDSIASGVATLYHLAMCFIHFGQT